MGNYCSTYRTKCAPDCVMENVL